MKSEKLKRRLMALDKLLHDANQDWTHPANDARHPKHELCLIGVSTLQFELTGLHTEATANRLFNSAQK